MVDRKKENVFNFKLVWLDGKRSIERDGERRRQDSKDKESKIHNRRERKGIEREKRERERERERETEREIEIEGEFIVKKQCLIYLEKEKVLNLAGMYNYIFNGIYEHFFEN